MVGVNTRWQINKYFLNIFGANFGGPNLHLMVDDVGGYL